MKRVLLGPTLTLSTPTSPTVVSTVVTMRKRGSSQASHKAVLFTSCSDYFLFSEIHSLFSFLLSSEILTLTFFLILIDT